MDLILEHHPETFTSQSILQVDSLTAFNLRALASHVHEFLATSPAKLTSSSILLFLDALRDLQQFYHFRLDWLDAGVRPFLSVPFRKIVRFHTSRQSRVEQRHAEATRIRNQIALLRVKLARLDSGDEEDEAKFFRLEEEFLWEAGPSYVGAIARDDLFFVVSSR